MLSAKAWKKKKKKQFLPQVGIFRTQLDIYDEDFFAKTEQLSIATKALQKRSIIDIRLGSKIDLVMRPAG